MHSNLKGIPHFAGGHIFQGSKREEGRLDIISLKEADEQKSKIGSGSIMFL